MVLHIFGIALFKPIIKSEDESIITIDLLLFDPMIKKLARRKHAMNMQWPANLEKVNIQLVESPKEVCNGLIASMQQVTSV